MAQQVASLYASIGLDASDLNRGLKDSKKKIGGLGSAMKGIGVAAAGLTAGIAVVGGITAGVVALAKEGAQLQQVSDAFKGIGGNLEALREGALGMVTDVDLMKSYNQAAQLVSKTFADELPDAMGYLSKVSAATGESMDFMIGSLVKGIGRLSPMILDNLGIQVSLAEATAEASRQTGKQAEALSKAEQQAGMMAVVMDKLRQNTAAMPDVAGSAAQKWGEFQTKLKNIKSEIGSELVPVMTALLDKMVPLVTDLGPKLIAWAGDFAEAVVKTLGKIAEFKDWLDKLSETEEENAKVSKVATGARIAATDAIEKAADKGNFFAGILQRAGEAENRYQKGIMKTVDAFQELHPELEQAAEATIEFASSMDALMLDAPLQATTDLTEAITALNQQIIESSNVVTGWEGDFSNLDSSVTDIQQRTTELREAWGEVFSADEVSDALTSINDVVQSHLDSLAGIEQSGQDAIRDTTFRSGLQRKMDAAQHQAEMLQMEQQYLAQKAALEAKGDTDGLARLEVTYANEKAQTEHAYDEGQARTEWNERVQQQLRERSQLVQLATQQRAYVAELKLQWETVKESLRVAVHKAEANKDIYGWEAKTILGIIGTSKQQALATEYDYVRMSNQLAKDWASGQVGSIQSAAAAYAALQKAQQGHIKEAQNRLEELQNQIDAFEIEPPPLVLPQMPGLAEFPEAVGDAAKTAAEKTKDATQRALADLTQAMDKGITAASNAVKALADFTIPAGFDDALKVFRHATVTMAKEMAVIWDHWNKELRKAVKAAPGLKAIGDTFSAFFKGMSQIGSFSMASGEDFLNRLDAYVWGLKIAAGKIYGWMLEIDATARKQLKLATPVAENVKKLFALIGPDLSKVVPVVLGFDAKSDMYFSQLEQAGVDIMTWINKIDRKSRVMLAKAVPVAENIKKLFDIVGVDLGGLADYEGLEMGAGSPWERWKNDMSAIATDIANWDLKVNVETMDDVLTKLSKTRDVVNAMDDVVQATENMVEVGGLDVGSLRAIMQQFEHLFNLPATPGWNAPQFGDVAAAGGGGGGKQELFIHILNEAGDELITPFSMSLGAAGVAARHAWVSAGQSGAVS